MGLAAGRSRGSPCGGRLGGGWVGDPPFRGVDWVTCGTAHTLSGCGLGERASPTH